MPEAPIPSRSAVVTGGASGIGRATVIRLLHNGWGVVAADMNDERLADVADHARREFSAGRLVTAVTDVRRESDVEAAVMAAVDSFGACTAIVNNAGVGGAFGPITEVEAEDWDYTFEVLVRGVFFGIKHAARAMQRQGTGGSIVNLASAAAFSGSGGPSAYSAAKAAVLNLTRAAAVELAVDRIRVNSVSPGAIVTPLLTGGADAPVAERPPAAQPWPDWGRPDDIAAVIAFLLGDDARFVTGGSLLADGGLVAAGPGPDFSGQQGTDPRHRGLVGVNRGSTGERSQVRRSL